MTDTPAHTPLPWGVEEGHIQRDSNGIRYWQITDGQDAIACNQFCYAGNHPAMNAANAAFIVRACNSHYQLVEALRGIIDHFDCSHGNAPGHDHLIPGVWDKDVSNGAKGGTQCVWCEQWNEARAALSQAGGASD